MSETTTDWERARHRARQLLAQPPELVTDGDLRAALEALLAVSDHQSSEIDHLVNG